MTFSMLLWFPNHPSSVFWSNSLRWILGFQSRHRKVRSCVPWKWCQEIGFTPYSLPTHWITIGKSINLRYLGFSFRKTKSLTGLQIDAAKSTSPPAGSMACTTPRADVRGKATSQAASGSSLNRKSSSSESHWLPSGTSGQKFSNHRFAVRCPQGWGNTVDCQHAVHPARPISNAMIKR